MALQRYDTIGIDLVAMCADDVVCSGAEPIAFLDYVAVGRLDPIGVAELVGSVAAGCREAGCTLIGGETAEHPGLMPEDAFDLAGSCIGVVERDALINGSAVRAGDAILGLAASGLHANGYSLVRSLIAQWDLDLGRPYQEQLRRSLGDADRDSAVVAEPEHALATLGEVLTPTRIYARGVLAARRPPAGGHDLRGLAHIGGGLPEERAAGAPGGPRGATRSGRWPMPSVMRLFGALGGIEDDELRATFNGGIGMVAVVAPDAVPTALAAFAAEGLTHARSARSSQPMSARPVRGGAPGAPRMSGGIAVGVSGSGRTCAHSPPRPTAASSGRRSCSSSPIGSALRSTGRRSRGSTRRSSRAATMPRSPRRSRPPHRMRSCSPATCG